MNMFDKVITKGFKDLNIIIEQRPSGSSPWENFVNSIKGVNFVISGSPSFSKWSKKLDARNVYTLDPRGNSEEVISNFWNKAGLVTASTKYVFDKFVNLVLEQGDVPEAFGDIKAGIERFNSMPSAFKEPRGGLIYNERTLGPASGKEKEWKEAIAEELINNRRNNRGISIFEMIQALRFHGLVISEKDIENKAIELFVKKKFRKNSSSGKTRWKSGRYVEDGRSVEINKAAYRREAEEVLRRKKALAGKPVRPDQIKSFHGFMQQYFAPIGVYYLTPQEYEMFKAGRMTQVKQGLEKVRQFMSRTAPTVRY